MKVKILDSDEENIRMRLTETSPAMANAIRRIIIGETPIMAVDNVNIYENTSVLIDEYIAHRLGMIPLTTDAKAYKHPADCCGGNCASCSVELTIDEEGPKVVYSSSIKTNDPRVKPVSGKIPVIKLGDKQRLRLEAKAMLGTSEAHAKWQGANAAYKYVTLISADKDFTQQEEVAKTFPGINAKGKKLEIDPVKYNGSRLVEEHYPGVHIDFDRTQFIFTVETNGSVTAKDSVLNAVHLLQNKTKELSKLLS